MGNYGRNDNESEWQERNAWRRSQSRRPSDRRNEYFGGTMQMGEGYSGSSEEGYDNYSRNYGGAYGDSSLSSESERRFEPSGRNRSEGDFGQSRYQAIDRTNRFNDRFSGYEGDAAPYQGRQSRYGHANYPDSESGYKGSDRTSERGWWDKTSDEVSSWFGDDEAARRRQMDSRRGPHRGRGPNSYTRSDERVKEDINDRLTDHSHLDASNIDVEVNAGEVILSGTVNDRNSKRLAEDIAEDISGVKNVENRLRVSNERLQGQSSADRPASQSAAGGSRS